MTCNNKIPDRLAQIRFQIALNDDLSNELIDEIEETVRDIDKIVSPLRIVQCGDSLFFRIDLKLKENCDQDIYKALLKKRLESFGEVTDLYLY